MRRSLVPVLVTLAALFATSVSVTAEASPAPDFGKADLPDVAAVARVFPHYEGGSVDVSRDASLRAMRAFTRSCRGLQEVARADRALLGYYLTEAGGSGADEGTVPYLLLHDFGSEQRAGDAIADARARTLACRGTHRVGGGASHTVAVKALAGFAGQKRIAWLDTVRPADGPSQALLIAYVRRGRFVVGAIFSQNPGTPSIARAELLLQQALDALGTRRGPG